ncbi:MAG: hypothetical protein PHU85_06545 [Phycisphaerae bacterium]|nr:hypothetical protein [Phycisphaerae bacterium]
MTAKERAVQIISRLPGEASTADIMAELYVQLKIERCLRDLDEGRVVDHATVKERLKKWTA